MKFNFILIFLFFGYLNTFSQKGFKAKEAKLIEGQVPERLGNLSQETEMRINLMPTFSFKSKDAEVIKEGEAVIYVTHPKFASSFKNAKSGVPPTAFDFLNAIKTELKLKSPSDEFTIQSNEKDDYGITHIKIQQHFKGINIYGGEAIIHSNKNGELESLGGKVFQTPSETNTLPAFDQDEAIQKALNFLSATSIIQSENNKLISFSKNSAELMLMYVKDTPKLIYHLTVKPNLLERWVFFMDAQTGEIIDKFNHTCTLDGVYVATAKDLNGIAKTFNIYQKSAYYFMIDAKKKMFNSNGAIPDNPTGTIWTIDGLNSKASSDMSFSQISSTNINNWSSTAVSAHTNASFCYDYYLNNFNRNSLNGNGGNIISVINIIDDDGKGLDNAYWNGEFMGYGNGQSYFKPLAGALDVAGHEMTHGVIENTAKLEYRNQSGALNESFADVFGVLIDRSNWLVGEQVVKPGVFPGGALRSFENPNQTGSKDPGYQPKTMAQYKYLQDTDAEDNGGVHINSGIPNYAFYKFATGTGMDKSKAEKVYYQVLTKYLTRTSKFIDLRLAVIQAAKSIYGDGQEVAAAIAAFNAVGITDPNATSNGSTTTTPTTDNTQGTVLSVNPGTENIVVYDPTTNMQNMYTVPVKTNLSDSEIIQITNNKGCKGKPSITDDGSFVYFVGSDYNIYRVNLSTKKMEQLTTEAIWRNVAVSKNGKLLVAVQRHDVAGKIVYNPNIYLFNLENNSSTSFQLYNPTYSAGVSTGEILYADSFEWDYSGENIIYDAYNEVKGVSSTINYWDVGLVKVFDAIGNKFLDKAVVQKVFSNLKRGENIGNPSISKTSTNIMAFDYYRPEMPENQQFRILIIDFDKSKILDSIANNDVAYPNFSKSDDILWYNSYDAKSDAPTISAYGLKSQSIVGVKNSAVLFSDAMWATPYAIGTRTLPTKEAQVITVNAISDKKALESVEIVAKTTSSLPLNYTLVSGDASLNGNILKLGTTPGLITAKVIQVGNFKYGTASADVNFCLSPNAPTLSDNGNTMTASGGSLYQLYINDRPVGGITTNTSFTKDFGGNYTVKSVTSDGCYSDNSNKVVSVALGIEPNSLDLMTLFPNPTESVFEIKIPEKELLKKYLIANVEGKIVLEGNTKKVNIAELAPGEYILKVETENNTYSKKIIKN